MRKSLWIAGTAAAAWVLLAGAAAAGPLDVTVSILPQKYFVERIGGDRVSVSVMVPPGASPATYEPRPRQMTRLARTGVYFAIGVPFERAWLERISGANPRMRLVHADAGIEKLPMDDHGHEDHGAPDPHAGLRMPDPHIWLSPPLAMDVARNTCRGLQAADPENERFYAANLEGLLAEIERLHADIGSLFEGVSGSRAFMVFHPSWGYFARAYGLRQIPVEIERKSPKPAHLEELIREARREGIRVIFVQPQFSTQGAEIVARAVGGRVVVADPLAEDWAANLRSQAEAFAAVLREGGR